MEDVAPPDTLNDRNPKQPLRKYRRSRYLLLRVETNSAVTEAYDWNPMPHVVDVICPDCAGHAEFEFADVVKIKLKKDVPYFQSSSAFEYRLFQDRTGGRWHGAIYYPGLHGSLDSISDLPEGFTPNDWAHSKYLHRPNGIDFGSIRCTSCSFAQKHQLEWPGDAYYLIEHKGHQLWAFNRESTVSIRDFIDSGARKTRNHKWGGLFLHIPTIFKKRNNRDALVKKLNKLLLL